MSSNSDLLTSIKAPIALLVVKLWFTGFLLRIPPIKRNPTEQKLITIRLNKGHRYYQYYQPGKNCATETFPCPDGKRLETYEIEKGGQRVWWRYVHRIQDIRQKTKLKIVKWIYEAQKKIRTHSLPFPVES